ncbi:peptidoglycan-binding domain-containing protein [Elioraea sp.]|uniref:peptidoglycan-binding domain-containing protein n=1 Tax=Elioraea sp. TaxID=2185103 RepID=UPI003F712D3C
MRTACAAVIAAGCCIGWSAVGQPSLHQMERGIGIMRDLGVIPGARPPPAQEAPPAGPSARSPAPMALLSPQQIRELQAGLIGLGYLRGGADGIAGPMTRRAISAFEADRGLPVTGAPTHRVLRAVEQAQGAQARPRDRAAGQPSGAGADLSAWLGTWEGFVECEGAPGVSERLPMRLEVRSGVAHRLPGRMQAGAGRAFGVTVEVKPASGEMAILPEAAVAQAPRSPFIALEGRLQPASGQVSGTVLGRCESFVIGRPGVSAPTVR